MTHQGRARVHWGAVCLAIVAHVGLPAAAPSDAGPWRQVGCGPIRSAGDVEVARLRRLRGQVADVLRTVAHLFPSKDLTEPGIEVVATCGELGSRRATFAPGRWTSYLVVPCPATDLDPESIEVVVRHVLDRALDRPPLWLVAGVGRYAASRDGDRLWPNSRDVVQLRNPWLPIRSVLSATDVSAEWSDASLRPRFIAQAGAYVAAWRARRPDGDLGGVVSRRGDGGPEAALVHVLGTDLDTFHASAQRYAREEVSIEARPARVEAEADTCEEALPPSAARARHVHILMQLQRVQEARAVAERALRQDPRSTSLAVARAVTRAAEGAREEATRECARAAAGDRLSDFERYQCAAIWLRQGGELGSEAEVPDEDAAAAMHLVSGLAGDAPADASYLEALARLRLGDAGGAASRALDAFARRPERRFALLVARAYVALKYVASAEAILRELADEPTTEDIRAEARAWLATLPIGRAEPARRSPVFRRLGPSERVATGRLLGIGCDEAWATLRVSVGDHVQAFVVARLDLLDIRNYRPSEPPEVRCGPRAAPELVRVSWRREATVPASVAGIAAALEFVPEDDAQ